MNSKVIQSKQASGSDIAKYVVAGALVVAGVFAFSWFDGQWPAWVRGLAVLVGIVLGAALFMATVKGATLREFIRESGFELRKVVWPTRQQAMRTTWVVAAVVVVFSLLLFTFDRVIAELVKLLLGA